MARIQIKRGLKANLPTTGMLAGEQHFTTDRATLHVAIDPTTSKGIVPAVDDLGSIGAVDGAADLLMIHDASATGVKEKKISIADFKQEMEVNFYGAIRLLQACLKGLKKSSSPSVVLYSTVAVQTGMGFHAGIASAKGAVEGLTRSLAAEWAPNKIRVNAIAPSLTETPLASALLSTPEKKEASDKRHPLGRVGRPEDIAEATVFLLSEKSSWMTGQILHLDGGMSHLK